MDEPIYVGNTPKIVDLKEGIGVYWCACGRSSKQPFCDGSHKGTTSIMPLYFIPEKDEKVALCMCKQTNTPPYCDESHCLGSK